MDSDKEAVDEAIDMLDASVFSGDYFLADKEARQNFREYMARWEKELKSFDDLDAEIAADLDFFEVGE